jgi:hypothetical protein
LSQLAPLVHGNSGVLATMSLSSRCFDALQLPRGSALSHRS